MINWMRYRLLYLIISLSVILPGMFGLAKWGFNTGIDFTGGTIVEFHFDKSVGVDELEKFAKDQSLNVKEIISTPQNSYSFRFEPLSAEQSKNFSAKLKTKFEKSEELRSEIVGAIIGGELIKKTIYAILISAIVILLWVAYQFKSIKYGASAVIAMLHDSLVLLGLFSLFGHFLGAQIDFLFVTAILTILSFSVHDTIVVYDRIREIQKKFGGEIVDIANKALTETMVRSLNNSVTIVFMLVALILLGGDSVKWFAVALLVGTVFGTYSSPFVAVPILVSWDNIVNKLGKK